MPPNNTRNVTLGQVGHCLCVEIKKRFCHSHTPVCGELRPTCQTNSMLLMRFASERLQLQYPEDMYKSSLEETLA